MPVSVLIVEEHNTNFKKPSILISEDEISFQQPVCQHQTAGFYSTLALRVSPNPTKTPAKCPQNSHQNQKTEKRIKRKKLDKSYHAKNQQNWSSVAQISRSREECCKR